MQQTILQLRTVRQMQKTVTNNRTMDFACTSNSTKKEVIHVEVLDKNVLVQHDLSLLTTNHLTPHYEKIFPDLKIAKEFACSKTKTTSILNEALAHKDQRKSGNLYVNESIWIS